MILVHGSGIGDGQIALLPGTDGPALGDGGVGNEDRRGGGGHERGQVEEKHSLRSDVRSPAEKTAQSDHLVGEELSAVHTRLLTGDGMAPAVQLAVPPDDAHEVVEGGRPDAVLSEPVEVLLRDYLPQLVGHGGAGLDSGSDNSAGETAVAVEEGIADHPSPRDRSES